MANIMRYRKKSYKPKVSSNIKKYVASAIRKNTELKSVDIQSDAQPVGGLGGGAISQLVNGIALGTTDFERVGNAVKLKKLYMKANITFPDTTNFVRLLLLHDSAPNGLTPSLADVFTFSGIPLRSFVRSDNSSRFSVLYDKLYSGGSNGPVSKAINPATINLKGREMRFIGNGLNLSDIQKGAIYLYMISDSIVSPNPTVNFMFRVFYTDS